MHFININILQMKNHQNQIFKEHVTLHFSGASTHESTANEPNALV